MPHSSSPSSSQRDTTSHSSKPAVRPHHVHDLEAALGSSIGHSFNVLCRQFRDTCTESVPYAENRPRR
ncbi:MAG: hypothetical protein BRD31_01420 [Bacteroidetes bacterium QH_2_64_26]|nr:MAG: hypothetical protein BRD31_01420 [Bacteroidetes bacterium QH_2_64_26]PSQ73132.1 MAG: hypothetical protein BRD39_04880 [Bacteroidetes bacterium QH_9_64_21]